MQCELVIWEKRKRRFYFFLVMMQRKYIYLFSMCIFCNATLFFLAMHICYNANLLHGRRKRSTLISFFLLQHKKKKKSSYCMFFGFCLATIFLLFVACNRLVTWKKKKKHTHASFSCYNISYIIIIILYFSSTLLFFWL